MELYKRLRIDESGIGRTFQDWKQIGPVFGIGKKPRRRHYVVCQCKCGTFSAVQYGNLTSGKSRSCIPCSFEKIAAKNRTHGMTNTPEYEIWCAMKKRCGDPNDKAYYNYGGRGIRVCERWLKSFENFIEDIGRRPHPECQLDRYPDNDGNYEPDNVRWTTKSKNMRNRRNNRMVAYKGVALSLVELHEKTGLDPNTVRARLARGWDMERATQTPPIKNT